MPHTRRRSLREIGTHLRQIELFDARGLDDITKRNLYWVIYGILFGQVYAFITTGAAWTGYLRDVLRADDFMLGIISAVPVAANTLQLLGAHLMQKYQKRRFFFLFFGLLARFFWLPIAFVPYLIPATLQSTRMMLVTAFIISVAGGNSMLSVSFASLMADIVPLRLRGRYFAMRTAVSMFTGLAGALLASYLVDTMGAPGYTLVLAIAAVFGLLDIGCYFFVKFPPMDVPVGGKPQGFYSSLRTVFTDRNFMRVVYVFTVWTFSVNITAPFFNVFMLETLGMNYTTITLTNQITSNVTTLLFVARWGRPLDRFGGKAVVQICASMCMLTPFMWLFAKPNMLWYMVLMNVITGFFWPAIDLGQQNLYFGASSSQNRAMYVAVFSAVFNLCGVALSNALGGLLLKTVYTSLAANFGPSLALGWSKYHWIFLTSGVLRVLVVFCLFPLLREEGGVPRKEALRTMRQELSQGVGRYIGGIRAARLRKRYRAQMEKANEDKTNEEMADEQPPKQPE